MSLFTKVLIVAVLTYAVVFAIAFYGGPLFFTS
jgi:hypothetical protein